jgi:hypothetical protein
MSSEEELVLVIDRIEGQVAVLISGSKKLLNVSVGKLPATVSEGAVLRVPIGAAGAPIWGEARVDEVSTQRRREEAQKILSELRKRDPGGDIQL